MLFNSYEFVFAFLPIVLLAFFLIGRQNQSLAASFLGLASLFFYAWFSINALPILLVSIVFNYFLGLKISQTKSKVLIQGAILANLLLLGFFKYFNFFYSSIALGLGIDTSSAYPILEIALPIGISFFTFTQIAFLVDCYQGKVRETNPVHYLLFVTYFPHLIAGPVLHHAQMMPQFAKKETYQLQYESIGLGTLIFAIGLAKKVLLANPLGEFADGFYNQLDPGAIPPWDQSWLAALAYTFQIYFDFSGYTDMAIGISLMFGIQLPINFNAPYRATSIIEFWRRWHISLSTFLRDYLYIPLGGNRHGKWLRYRNLMLTMILGGLWHGASWNFVLWGFLHGLLLSMNHLWQSLAPKTWSSLKGLQYISWLLTFTCIVITFLIFRVENNTHLTVALEGLINFTDSASSKYWISSHLKLQDLLILLAISFLVIAFEIPTHQLKERLQQWNLKIPMISINIKIFALTTLTFVTVLACINRVGSYNPFLYFQF